MNTSDPLFESIFLEPVYGVPPTTVVQLHVPWNELAPDQQALLDKILKAVGLSLAAVRIVHQDRFDVSGWVDRPGRILAFVPAPKGVNMYEIVPSGAMVVVFSDPLEKISGDEASKRKLWAALKVLFPA